MNWLETDLGFIQEKDNYLIFFGKNSATLDKIKQAYPDLTFRTVHQTHSDICVLSAENTAEMTADAHYTSEPNVALVVKTADCLPILAYDLNLSSVLAVHAGWRGIENQITSKSLQQVEFKKPNVFIGPSIQQNSFEVDLAVKAQLEKICKIEKPSADFANTFIAKNGKFYINLTRIVDAEIKAAGALAAISTLPLDTLTDLRFHSYRRDKQNSGRNISFIARLSRT